MFNILEYLELLFLAGELTTRYYQESGFYLIGQIISQNKTRNALFKKVCKKSICGIHNFVLVPINSLQVSRGQTDVSIQ